jgi:putative flippase GtrA
MIGRLAARWPGAMQLARYGIVGLVTNLAGYLIYLLLTWAWLEPKMAVSLLYPVGVIAGFFGHARYSFTYRGRRAGAMARYLLAHAIGYGANIGLLYAFTDRMGFPHQAVQAAAIFVVAALLFVLFKFMVFPQGQVPGPSR